MIAVVRGKLLPEVPKDILSRLVKISPPLLTDKHTTQVSIRAARCAASLSVFVYTHVHEGGVIKHLNRHHYVYK